MKKRFILLPLLLFVLAGCDPVVPDPTDSSTTPTTEEPTTEDPTTEDPTTEDPADDRTDWQKSLPEGYSSIAEILEDSKVDDLVETRGKVTFLNGGQIMIQDGDGDAILLYEGGVAPTLTIGDVIDTCGKFSSNANMPQLAYDVTGTYVTKVDEDCDITPIVIETVADYTSKLADFDHLKGEGRKQVLVKGVSVTSAYNSPNKNFFTIETADKQSFNVLTGYNTAHDTAGENRKEIEPLVNLLHVNEDATFDLLGVYYNVGGSNPAWQIGITTIDAFLNVPDDLEEPGEEPFEPVTPDGAAAIDFTTNTQRVSLSTDAQVWKSDDSIATLTVEKNGATNVADYIPIRVYKNHKVTFSVPTGYLIVSVVVNSDDFSNGQYNASAMLGDGLTVTGATVAVEGLVATFTANAYVEAISFVNSNAQTRWLDLTINYAEPVV